MELTSDDRGRVRLRRLSTEDLTPRETDAIRALLSRAFGSDDDERFTDDDWEHAVGGTHFVLEVGDAIVSHASVVERELRVDGGSLRTGYVEAVATAPEWQGRGHGTRVMRDVSAFIGDRFELGSLGTGAHGFYERLGWRTWTGPSSVRAPDGDRPTPDDDGYLMILRTPTTPALDLDASISCDWRTGDVW